MTDFDIRICPACLAVFVEDDQLYEDNDRCPNCGADLTDTDAAADD